MVNTFGCFVCLGFTSKLLIFTGGIYCYNGYDCQYYDDVLMFDPKTFDWKKIGSMKIATHFHAASLVNIVDVIDYCKN